MAHDETSRETKSRSTSGRAKPTLRPPKVEVHGAWGRALPAPNPGEKAASTFTSRLTGLLGRPHPGTPRGARRGACPALTEVIPVTAALIM